jgi:ATP-binding cassette subfamily C protein CydC
VNGDVARLVRWLRRARPPRRDFARALVAGIVASIINVAMVVGAVALLVESATRPGLHAVLGVLIVIELFAFLRSPLRFAERLSAHRLGYAAVTLWRRWLVATIGRLEFSQWRTYAAGDLLERSLRDTDELQDLWLRCVIPLITTVSVMVIGDVFIGLLPPRGSWWTYALVLLTLQVLGVAALIANFGPLLRRDRALRQARGGYQAQLVELSAVTPDLVLLGRGDFARARSSNAVAALRDAERSLRRQQRLSDVAVFVVSGVALAALGLHPDSSPLWIVVSGLLALSTFELLSSVRRALDTAIGVSAGAERLEDLDVARERGHLPWPDDSTIRLEDVTLVEDGATLVANASLTVAPGSRVALTGVSGTGKSTLLRALGALDSIHDGTITVGGIALDDLDESELRRNLTYVPSEPGLTRGFALDVVGLGRATSREPINDLAALGIATNRTTRFDELSRGERERVAIARALVSSPTIFLLDEPTSGLGRDETDRVLALIEATGATVVVATHDPRVIQWCDEVVELRDSKLHVLSR